MSVSARNFFLFATVFALVACTSKSNLRERVVLADANQAVFGLVYIAQHLGYFSEEGLDVEFRDFTLGKDALGDVLAGHSDLATVYSSPVVNHMLTGGDTQIVTTLHRSRRNTALVGRRDRGVLSVSDLTGKRIGLTKGTNGDYFLELLLAGAGIDMRTVEIVDVSTEQLGPMLKSGNLDGIILWGHHLIDIQNQLTTDVISILYSPNYSETSVIAGTPSFFSNRSSAAQKFISALVRAEDYFSKNREQSQLIISNQFHDQPTAIILRSLAAAELLVRLDNVLLHGMEDEALWVGGQSGIELAEGNFERFFRTDFLSAVNPLYVTLSGR